MSTAKETITKTRLEKLQATLTGKDRVRVWDPGLVGYGASVTTQSISFLVKKRVKGRQIMITIGKLGYPGPGDKKWTEDRARKAALSMLGTMAAGVDPRATATTGEGVTLQQALDLHVATMKKKGRSPRSIKSITDEVKKHFAGWLARPLVELTADAIEKVCEKAKSKAKPRAYSANLPGQALENRLLAHVSAIWESSDKRYDLPKNPAKRLDKNKLSARKERIGKGENSAIDFKGWLAKVNTLAPVRRDLQLFVLFSSLRSESARTIEWSDVDFKERLLHVRKVKGGEERQYTIPLTRTLIEILERRRTENAIEFGPHGGDYGFVFPTRTRARPYRIKPVAEAREIRKGERYLPGPHSLRRTWNSVAIECGINGEHRRAMMNHESQGINVRAYGVPEYWGSVRQSAETVEAELRQRLGLDKAAKAKRRRRRS